VEADVGAIGPPVLLGDPHHDRAYDLALLDLAARLRGLDGGDDDVADRRVLAVRAAEDADTQELAGSAVVRHSQPGLLLDHRAVTGPRAVTFRKTHTCGAPEAVTFRKTHTCGAPGAVTFRKTHTCGAP